MVCIRRGFFYSLLIASVLVLISGSNVNAQQVFGSIIGTVTDPSGSAVANAKVTITDVTKGTSFDTTTNDSGEYSKGQLIPDTYKVTIEATGFQKVVSNDLQVLVDQSTPFNATMTVGNVEQTVEVTAAAPLLQTDRADVAQTFTAKELSELPSVGRNLQSFELLNPGVVKFGWQHASDENPQGSVQTEVNGQLFDSTGYYLDGTINQDPILGIIVINPTFDSVNEVKQSSQDYDAEFGYTGAGLMTYSTKSGTNDLHGDAFEYIYLNTPGFQDFGRDPFAQNTPLAPGVYTPTTHQSQFGGSIGGRIIKDKLFFFGDAQLSRNHTGGSVLAAVPTAQDRTGNLSDWLAINTGTFTAANGTVYPNYQIFDPATGNPTNGTGRTPFPGNIIPANRISPQALNLINSYFPLPDTAQSCPGCPYNNFSGSGVLSNDANQWNTRWDYYASQKDTIFGRFSSAGFNLGGPGVFGVEAGGPALTGLTTSGSALRYAGESTSQDYSIAAGWTHTASATLVNEFRFGYMKYHVNDVPGGYGTTPASSAGIPGMNLNNTYASGLPYFEVDLPTYSGSASATTAYQLGYDLADNGCNCPLTQTEQQYQFVDNISKIHGNHNFKIGADIRYALNLRVPSDNHRAGEVYFNDSNTAYIATAGGPTLGGNGFASFLLGDPEQFQRYVSSSTDAMEHQKRLFWYGQDEWRVTPKLTFTYGLRWEMVFPETVNAPGNGAELNVNTGLMEVFGEGLVSSHGYQNMNWHEFAPRVSLAYQVTPKTVVRAGYGWTYSLGTFGSTFGHNVTQNPPILVRQTINQGNTCGNNFCDVFTLGPTGNGLSVGPPLFNPAALEPGPNGTYPLSGVAPNNIEVKTRPGIFTMPVFYLFNFTVQHQLTNKISVQGGYVGNQGRHTPLGTDMSFNMNQPEFVPGVGAPGVFPFNGGLGPRYDYGWTQGIDNYCNCANNEYNSFQGLVKIAGAGGYTLTGNYTWQSSQGDGWGGNEAYTFLYDRPLGWGNNPNIPHQQIVVAQTWNIPFGRGRKWGSNVARPIDWVLGGWNVSGVTSIYSGIPFMPTLENYGSGIQPYTGPNNRPDVGSGSPYPGTKNRNQWIVGCPAGSCTTGPYLFPASNAFGNYPVNTLYGPWFFDQDASVMKQFSITERLKFTLRTDARNAFNHTNLATPNADVQSGTVGRITGLAFGGGNMRLLQYSGTISW
jgi:outer membrane receptor protein involved in Fe transport